MPRTHRPPGELSTDEYFFERSVFTLGEFLNDHPRHTPATATALLAYYVKRGTLMRMKRGLYQDVDSMDPTGVGARWAPDAVVGYLGAFWFHSSPDRRELTAPRVDVLTRSGCASWTVDDQRIINVVAPPRALGKDWRMQVERLPWNGGDIRVTTFERTVVDLMDRIDLRPDLDVLWREIAHRRPNATQMIDYALKLKNRLAQARLGFILEHLPGTREADLARLPRLKGPSYFDEKLRGEERPRHLPRWNLIVPNTLAHYMKQTDFYRAKPRFTEIQDPRW